MIFIFMKILLKLLVKLLKFKLFNLCNLQKQRDKNKELDFDLKLYYGMNKVYKYEMWYF